MKTSRPRALRQRALRMLGREASTSLVTGIWRFKDTYNYTCSSIDIIITYKVTIHVYMYMYNVYT